MYESGVARLWEVARFNLVASCDVLLSHNLINTCVRVCVCVREDYEDGLHREFEMITHSVDVWHVSEYSRHHIHTAGHGQFHDEDAYVVCWHYAISQGETLTH